MSVFTYARDLTYEQVFVTTNFYRSGGADFRGWPADTGYFNGCLLTHVIRAVDDGYYGTGLRRLQRLQHLFPDECYVSGSLLSWPYRHYSKNT